MIEIKQRKNELREAYKEKRRLLSPEEKREKDGKICELFMSLVSYRYSDTILMYSPLKNEIDVLPIGKNALEKNKNVAFPLCDSTKSTMTYHLVTDVDNDLKKGSFGILEPHSFLPEFNMKQTNAVILVPGLVFDKKGYRIGYGKGYYDRYLSSFKGTKIGICYSDFILDEVPRGRFDTSVDFIITEKGVKKLNES